MARPYKIPTKCSIDGCDRCSDSRGWCKSHWKRWKRSGSPTGSVPRKKTPPCSVPGCDRQSHAHKLCPKHLQRVERLGTVTLPPKPTIADRLWAKVDRKGRFNREIGRCWEWTGYRHPMGHGMIGDGRRLVYTHRVSWEITNGPIPSGLLVCHHCDNPPCVRPSHLFVGTQADNVRDMWAKGRARPSGTPHPARGTTMRSQLA